MKNKLFVLQIVFICLFYFFSSCSKDVLLVKEESTNLKVKLKSTIPFDTYSEIEPNNTLATANGTISPFVTMITGIISTSGDVDWYKLYCKNGVTISAAPSASGHGCVFYDSDGNSIGSSSFTPNYTGICYLRIAGLTREYEIIITQSLPTESENNNTISTANSVALNSCISGIATNGQSDIDYFVLTPDSYDAITFYLDAGSSQVTAKIYNSDNVLLETINKGMAMTIPPLSHGNYYIQIQGSMPVSGYSVAYTLYINPPYSIVNPIYFYCTGKLANPNPPFLPYAYYKCSSNSFSSLYAYDVLGSSLYYSTAFKYYVNNSYPNAILRVTGIYPNGFPLIICDLIVSN